MWYKTSKISKSKWNQMQFAFIVAMMVFGGERRIY